MSERNYDDALLTLAFSIESNPGAYALLIGAGVSAGSGVKTAWGVLEDLVRRMASLQGASSEELDNPVGWYESKFGEEPRYETLLEQLAPTSHERQRLLRGYFEPTAEEAESGQKGPTQAHHAIARLIRAGMVRVVVTLNFDRLIEQAVRAVGVEPTVIASPADAAGMAPLHTLDCCVIHLHGDYLSAPTMRNTISELAEYQPPLAGLLQRVLEDYGLIIAGWSSQYDPVLRASIASHYPARYTLAWIEPMSPSDNASELRALKKGLLLPSSADDAFGRLADAVEALRTRNTPHPLTVPVAVRVAKRQLSDGTAAIDLHDTLNEELTRLHNHRDFHLTNYQSDAPYGGYLAMLDRVEESSRITCALVAALTYWGTPDTDRWWIDELRRFAVQPRIGGSTRLLRLKMVTGSALLYAAGVAAVAAHRFDVVARLLAAQVPDPYAGQQRLALETLDPASVYELSHGMGRTYGLVEPILREALAINPESLDEAWQRFEVLRLAALAMHQTAFAERNAAFQEADRQLSAAQQRVDTAERDGGDVDDALSVRQEAFENRGRRLGQLANLVRPAGTHLLAATDNDGRHRVPIADRLAEEVAIEGGAHPLITADIARDAGWLSAALEAVSAAGGRQGNTLAWNRIPDGHAGIIVDEIWLDTGKPPGE